MFFLILITLCCPAVLSFRFADYVARPNLGVVFTKEKEHMIAGHAELDFFYEIPLVTLEFPKFPKLNFDNLYDACKHIRSTVTRNSFSYLILQCKKFEEEAQLVNSRVERAYQQYLGLKTLFQDMLRTITHTDEELLQEFATTHQDHRTERALGWIGAALDFVVGITERQ